MIKKSIEGMDNVTVASFEGLLVDFAKQHKARLILRGIRAVDPAGIQAVRTTDRFGLAKRYENS